MWGGQRRRRGPRFTRVGDGRGAPDRRDPVGAPGGPRGPRDGADTFAAVQLSGAELAGLAALGVFAGWLGALIGIGGGIIVVPALVLAFGYDIHLAVAVSLVCVVATSTAAGSAYVGEGWPTCASGWRSRSPRPSGGSRGG